MISLITLGFSDLFYNVGAVFASFGLIFFIAYFTVLSKTILGRGENNKGPIVIISLVLALLSVYGIYKKENLFYLPSLSLPELFSFSGLSYLFSSLGFFGILLAAAMLIVLFKIAKAFYKFLRVNFGLMGKMRR